MTEGDKAAWLEFEPAAEAKPQSFAHHEMITCDGCLRANPPTRGQCLYCGAGLPVAQVAQDPEPTSGAADSPAQFPSGPLPEAVDAYYVALAPPQTTMPSDSAAAEIGEVLRLKPREVLNLFEREWPVPLARAVTAEQAAGLTGKLQALGINAYWFKDDAADPMVPPRKVTVLEFSDDGFTAITASGGRIATAWDELRLMVAGRLLTNRVEVEGRRRRGRAQPLGTRELFSDEPVLDLYTNSADSGWRISSSSFDFSCLGSAKAMTAFENFTALMNLLRLRAPNAELDEAYISLRPVLENVWPREPQTRKGEWRRSGAGKVDVATVTTTDNEAQFNCYSRFSHKRKLRALEGRE